MSILRVRLPRPHSGQRKVKHEAKRFNALACGVRWGKSTFGMDCLSTPALQGFPVAWYAPSNKSLAESWELAKRTFREATSRKLEDKHVIELVTGGKIEMWSLENPDSSRGRKYKLAVFDEAAHARHLEYAWTRVVRQRLTDFRGGAWFLSTPAGMNYFKSLFDRGQDVNDPEWKSWQIPSAGNPFLPDGEIESARADMSELAFAQEYLAQFVTWEGAVFRRIMDAVELALPSAPVEDHHYVIGVDWGKQNDYTVFAVVDCTSHQVVSIDRSRGVDYTMQQGRLAALRDRWSFCRKDGLVLSKPSVIAEANSMGTPIIDQLRKDGIPVVAFDTTNASKAAIIGELALAFERSEIKIPNDPILLGELQQFQATKLPSGMTRYEAPSGGHDDMVIALAIAWEGARKDSKRSKKITVVTLDRHNPFDLGNERYEAQR